MQITKKKFITLAIVFGVGFAGGMLAEHIIHLVQDKTSGHHAAVEHGERSN